MDDNVNRIRIMKLWEVLSKETDEAHPMKTETLLSRLDSIGFKCHRKTLYNDIKTLNSFGYEIMVDRGISNAYYVIDREFDVPEIQILMDAVQGARFISEKKTVVLIDKIASLAGSKRAEVLKKNVVDFKITKSQNEQIYYNVNAISEAITESKQLSFRYFKYDLNGKKVYRHVKRKYVVNPVATVFCDDKYYLICYDDKHKNLCHYRVDKMDTVNVEESDIVVLEGITEADVQMHKKQLYGMFGGEARDVSFSADKSLVDALYDKFGQDLVLEEQNDRLYFTLNVQVSPNFISWIIGFGSKIKVLAPSDIVKKIKDRLAETLSVYEE